MANIIAALQRDHQNVLVLLQQLDSLANEHSPARPADFVSILDIMQYMTRYPDMFHHPKEELLFNKLVERDARVEPVVATLIAEHKVLGEKGGQLLQSVRNLVNGFVPYEDDLAPACQDYVSYLRMHMTKEETEVFPLASKLLSDDDWGAIERGLVAHEDPLFGTGRAAEYLALYNRIVSAANEET